MPNEATSAARADKIRCDDCPVMCYIKRARPVACDATPITMVSSSCRSRIILLEQTIRRGRMVRSKTAATGDGKSVARARYFVTAIGAGTPYPDTARRRPRRLRGRRVDRVTVVTEGILKLLRGQVKIDTDRYLGRNSGPCAAQGEAVGNVTTSRIWLADAVARRVQSLTGGSKKGRTRHRDTLMDFE